MLAFVARINHSSRFTEAGLQASKQGWKWPEDVAPIVTAHIEYLKGLRAEGRVICGGPMVAFTHGLSVIRADSLAEAKKLIENDPAKKNGLYTDFEIEPWYHIV
jgi:uncharacterized protein YciI